MSPWELVKTTYKIAFGKDGYIGLARLFKSRIKNMFSKKIRVGFGPIYLRTTAATRRFHVDPIVDYINNHSEKYTCDVFLKKDNLSRFDIIVIVKDFDNINNKTIEELKKKEKVLIYRIIDSKSEMSQKDNINIKRNIELMDGILVTSNIMEDDVKALNPNIKLIEAPIITHKYKHNYKNDGVIRILWEGYKENMGFMDRLHPVLKKLEKECGQKFNFIYNTDLPARDEGLIKYIKWELSKWEDVLVDSDISVAIKPLEDKYQQRKPSTKINTHRVAGLPVVCTPSEADRAVIEHGRTGFFAYTEEEWYKYLKELIENAELREKIGRAGREYVLKNFGIETIAQKYISFFDEVIVQKQRSNGEGVKKTCTD